MPMAGGQGPHELVGGYDTHQLVPQEKPAVEPVVGFYPPLNQTSHLTPYDESRKNYLQHQTPNVNAPHEIDPSEALLPEWAARSELEAQQATEISRAQRESGYDAASLPTSPYSIARKPMSPGIASASSDMIGAAPSTGDAEADEREEARLAVLRDRIERIRADKERLEEIQRLARMEEETKAEIMAAVQRQSRPS
jgi:hypothetical protein